MPPKPLNTPISTRSHSAQAAQQASTPSSSTIPSNPTTSLSLALAASSLQSQSQSQPQPHPSSSSSDQASPPSPPSSSQKHQESGGRSQEEGEGGKEREKKKGKKKRARPLGDEEEEEEVGDEETAKRRKREEEQEKEKERERKVREGISWSGKLDEEIITFDARAKAKDPLEEFEEKNRGFMDELMMEFHLILLEMHVWSNHRIDILKRKRRLEIKQSLKEIQAEEAKQEENRLRLLSFMNQIHAAVEGISSIDPLIEPARRR